MRISDWSSDVCSSDLWMLRDLALAGDLRYVALRYFNVAGADPQGRSGQLGPVATHLIKIASQVVAGRRESISIFGDDYDTPDGTRTEERRVGKEGVSTWRSRWAPCH